MAELIANIYLENLQKITTNTFTIRIVTIALESKFDSLSKKDLGDICNDILSKVNLLLSQNESAFESGAINLIQRNNIRSSLDRLLQAQYDLNAARINIQLDLLTDEQNSAKAKIIEATGRLQKAQMDLQEIDKFLTFISKVISLVNAITSSIESLSVASISSLLKQILNG